MNLLLPSISRRLVGVTLLFTSIHLSFCREILFSFSAAARSTSLELNAAKSFIFFGRIQRQPQAWWSSEVEKAVKKRRKTFASAHVSDLRAGSPNSSIGI